MFDIGSNRASGPADVLARVVPQVPDRPAARREGDAESVGQLARGPLLAGVEGFTHKVEFSGGGGIHRFIVKVAR